MHTHVRRSTENRKNTRKEKKRRNFRSTQVDKQHLPPPLPLSFVLAWRCFGPLIIIRSFCLSFFLPGLPPPLSSQCRPILTIAIPFRQYQPPLPFPPPFRLLLLLLLSLHLLLPPRPVLVLLRGGRGGRKAKRGRGKIPSNKDKSQGSKSHNHATNYK